MAPAVTSDADVVGVMPRETMEKRQAASVRLPLTEHQRSRRLCRLADLAGKVDLSYSNDELETLEER
ncbi:MAG: hypothetical protein OXH04_00480 [Acidobacteria bacterium]|nr:hypothetical protein [Acidobacteriota bacterium]